MMAQASATASDVVNERRERGARLGWSIEEGREGHRERTTHDEEQPSLDAPRSDTMLKEKFSGGLYSIQNSLI